MTCIVNSLVPSDFPKDGTTAVMSLFLCRQRGRICEVGHGGVTCLPNAKPSAEAHMSPLLPELTLSLITDASVLQVR